MKIIELGHTGVGKTTFMAAMYGRMQQSIEGFSLRAVDLTDHDRLLKLATAIQRGKYPAPTDQRSEYNFYLRYNNKDVFPFCWSDHRGGALVESLDNQQAQLLQADLQQADGVLMFCDSQALVRKDRRSNQIGRMIALLNRSLAEVERPLAIGVVLTKTDLVDPDSFNETFFDPFRGLFDAIKASETLNGQIIPVACGKHPLNIELPVLFALHVGISLKFFQLKHEMEQYEQQSINYEQRTKGVGGVLREIWHVRVASENGKYSTLRICRGRNPAV